MFAAFVLAAASLLGPPSAPVFKLTDAVERRPKIYLTFEVTNPNAILMPYYGYTPDSFSPKTPGAIAPLYGIEYLRGKDWKKFPSAWCGTGIGPVSIPAKGKMKFEASVPVFEWEEVRFSLIWYPMVDEKDPQIAWSNAVERKTVKKGEDLVPPLDRRNLIRPRSEK
jgi:hypothetical protein